MTNKKVPELRFEGFVDDWEQRKFTDIVDRVNLTSNSNEIPKVEFEDIVAGEGRLNKDRSEKFDSRKGTIFHPNNILYGKLRPYLKNWLLPTFKGIALGDFWVFEAKNTDAMFDYYLIQADKYQKIANDTSGTKMPRSDWRLVSNSLFSIPKEEEQIKIGTLFKQLDDTITLHLRKLEYLKQMKQGYLQVMFPQNDEKVPKVRFDNFEKNWEHRKMDELVTLTVREIPKPEIAYERLSIRSHAKGTFHQLVENPSKVAMDKLFVVRENDLVVNITFAWEHAIAIARKEDEGKLVSHRFPTFLIDKSNINFIEYSVSQETFRRKMELISPGGAGRNRVLNKKDFMEIKIVAPTLLKEQTRIGNFFKQLDDTITYHHDKLQKLQKLKKAFLQKMFI